jgi:hypothetical protein
MRKRRYEVSGTEDLGDEHIFRIPYCERANC